MVAPAYDVLKIWSALEDLKREKGLNLTVEEVASRLR